MAGNNVIGHLPVTNFTWSGGGMTNPTSLLVGSQIWFVKSGLWLTMDGWMSYIASSLVNCDNKLVK